MFSGFHKLGYKIKCAYKDVVRSNRLKRLRRDILSYYSTYVSEDEEIIEVVEYLKDHPLKNKLFPCSGPFNPRKKVKCGMNPHTGLPYVIHQDKKLYFIKKPTNKALKNHYLSLLEEQSQGSPHVYVTDDFDIKEGDVLYDIGSAEGIFALSNIEKVSRVVLFEGDESWINVLQSTFEPWKEKVTIVPKYVSDINSDQYITIDAFIEEYGDQFSPDFIKIDVEGAEMNVLKGMVNCISKKKFKMAVTTYHYQDDYANISSFLSEHKVVQKPSKGVTLIGLDKCKAPYFRKALIRAYNRSESKQINLQ
jgi:hypothetical protein